MLPAQVWDTAWNLGSHSIHLLWLIISTVGLVIPSHSPKHPALTHPFSFTLIPVFLSVSLFSAPFLLFPLLELTHSCNVLGNPDSIRGFVLFLLPNFLHCSTLPGIPGLPAGQPRLSAEDAYLLVRSSPSLQASSSLPTDLQGLPSLEKWLPCLCSCIPLLSFITPTASPWHPAQFLVIAWILWN